MTNHSFEDYKEILSRWEANTFFNGEDIGLSDYIHLKEEVTNSNFTELEKQELFNVLDYQRKTSKINNLTLPDF